MEPRRKKKQIFKKKPIKKLPKLTSFYPSSTSLVQCQSHEKNSEPSASTSTTVSHVDVTSSSKTPQQPQLDVPTLISEEPIIITVSTTTELEEDKTEESLSSDPGDWPHVLNEKTCSLFI